MVKLSLAAKRTARSMRKWSSANARAGSRIARKRLALNVCLAADEVEEFVGDRIEKEAVAGEIPTLGVFLGGGEGDGIRMAAVGVNTLGAESGDFDGRGCGASLLADEHDAEGHTDLLGFREQGEDLVGAGGSGDIVVGGDAAHEAVADTAAGEIGGVTRALELFDDASSEGFG